jgi:tRNA-specific 2-thiouridylase
VVTTDAATNRVVVGEREALRRDQVSVRAATLHRDGARVDRVKLRYRTRPLSCRLAGAPPAGRHPELRLSLDEPIHGAAPGQTAVLMDGDTIVGHATIAA